jgi:hypothetical protein
MMPTPTRDATPVNGEADARAILDWLATPPSDDTMQELARLHAHLAALEARRPPPAQLQKLLGLMQARTIAAVDQLTPRLFNVRLPISPQTRRSVRSMQDVLELLATLHAASADDAEGRLIKGLGQPAELSLWRAADALARTLFLSNLISAPALPGIWQQLHAIFASARQRGLDSLAAGDAGESCRRRYLRALALNCAPPSAFTALEWQCIDRYVQLHIERVALESDLGGNENTALFWVDLQQDMAPVAHGRRPMPEHAHALGFNCQGLDQRIDEDRRLLRKGAPAAAIGFPPEIPARLARALLHRLKNTWGTPRKRRFPRRRQSYRASLCFGFEAIWQLLRNPTAETPSAASEWMVTNESPDGYATMHVAGRPQKLQIGDLIALRINDAENAGEWQIGMVRWALSENPEHLEVGLQIVSPRAVPAMLALPGQRGAERHPVLLLPAVPPLRHKEAMAADPGLLFDQTGKLLLMIESDRVEIRESKLAGILEQSPNVDLFLIEPDESA